MATKFIEWGSDLSIGVEVIDHQHHKLVELVNTLHEAITENRAFDTAMDIIDELINYTQTHFLTEEVLMNTLNYPDFEEHKEHHEQLIKEVSELKKRLESGKETLNFQLIYFMKQWLTKHILGDDKCMGEIFLKIKKRPSIYHLVLGRLKAVMGLGQTGQEGATIRVR